MVKDWTGHYAVVAVHGGKKPKIRKTETRIDKAVRYAQIAAKHEPNVEFFIQRVETLYHVTNDGSVDVATAYRKVGVDKRTQ